MEEDFKYISQSIQRTIDVLLAFTAETPEWGLVGLAVHLDLPKSTIHRAIVNLEVRGLLQRDEATGKFRLGVRLFELGMRAGQNMDLRVLARPHIEKLSEKTGEMIALAILSEQEVLYLDVVHSSKALRAASTAGQRRPLHCTAVGKVLLAGLPPHEIYRIIEATGLPPRTSASITDPEQLYEALSRIREQNYTLDLGEFEEGLCCMAAPILDETEKITASIGVSGPLTRFNKAARATIINLLQATAQAISRDLGYTGSSAQISPEVLAVTSN